MLAIRYSHIAFPSVSLSVTRWQCDSTRGFTIG